jgi:RNA polymerase sigma factor (sigma-70 family)
MRLRATLKIRNDRMVSARERLGLSQTKLAEAAAASLHCVIELESLDYSRKKGLFEISLQIATVLGVPLEHVLPDGVEGKTFLSKFQASKDLPIERLLPSPDRKTRQLTDGGIGEAERRMDGEPDQYEVLDHALFYLTQREREIIRSTYGLPSCLLGRPRQPETRKSIAERWGITTSRVRQIEAKALRKLQHKFPIVASAGDPRTQGPR